MKIRLGRVREANTDDVNNIDMQILWSFFFLSSLLLLASAAALLIEAEKSKKRD